MKDLLELLRYAIGMLLTSASFWCAYQLIVKSKVGRATWNFKLWALESKISGNVPGLFFIVAGIVVLWICLGQSP